MTLAACLHCDVYSIDFEQVTILLMLLFWSRINSMGVSHTQKL